MNARRYHREVLYAAGVVAAVLLCAGLLASGCSLLPETDRPVLVSEPDPASRPGPLPDGEIAVAGADGIYVANADGSGAPRELTDLRPGPSEDLDIEQLDWSPDGGSVFFATSVYEDEGVAQVHRLRSVRADGSGETTLLAESSEYSGIGDFAASPDGARVAFMCDSNLCVVNADGSGLARLGVGPILKPGWLPGGRKVSFVGDWGNGREEIFAVNPDGTGLERVGVVKTDSPAAESPDGERARFCAQEKQGEPEEDDNEEDFKICVENAEGREVARLPGGAGTALALYWSPDGQHLAFTADRELPGPWLFPEKGGSEEDLYVVDRRGSEATRLVKDVDNFGGEYTWSPDGEWLLFEDGGDVFVAESDGSSAPEAVLESSEKESFGSPRWRPAAGDGGVDG